MASPFKPQNWPPSGWVMLATKGGRRILHASVQGVTQTRLLQGVHKLWRCYRWLACAIVKNSMAQWLAPKRCFPYRLGLSITNRCNHRCTTCRVWRTAVERPGAIDRELRLEEFEALFRSFGGGLCWIGITGGEPTLRGDLVDIVRVAARHCHHLGFVSINTNGLLTDRITQIAESLLADAGPIQFMFVVSIDGPRELHDRIRGVTGAFDRAIASVAALDRLARRHRRLSVHTETVISKFNLSALDAFSRETPRDGVAHVYTFAMEGTRYSNTGGDVQMSADDFRQVRDLMSALGGRGRLRGIKRLIMEEYYRLAERFFADPARQVLPCASSLASIYIGAEGEVRPCSMMEPVGSLREMRFDIRELIASEPFQAARKCIMRGTCPNCWTPCEAIPTLMHRQHRALPRIWFRPKGS